MKYGLFGILFLISFSICSQETLTLKYFGLAVHPFGDRTAHLQPNKLDKDAKFVLNYGLFAGYEKFLYEDLFSVKFIQGFTSDCSNGWASVSHIGPRVALLKLTKHRIYFGVGPTFIIRESWTRFGEDYQPSGFFNVSETNLLGTVQWKFIPYGFEFEYDYAFSAKDQLSVSFTPGIPAMTCAIGWKHWFHLKEFDPYRIFVPHKKRRSN